jgi:replicative superfamily II helicase
MSDLLTIESLCQGLNGYKNHIEINHRINEIHFLITKYLLSIDNDIDTIEYIDLKKLKEIALYLFDIVIDDLFLRDIEPESRKTIFTLCQNIFEQLCKIYQKDYDRYKNEYFELTFMAIACASIGKNPAKSFVLFKKYVDGFITINTIEEKILLLLNAYLAKDYKFVENKKTDILVSIKKGDIQDDLNKVLIKIFLQTLKMINYFKTGNEKLIAHAVKELEEIRQYCLDNDYYREIWIIKVLIKHINVSVRNSMWKVLGPFLSPDTIKLFVEDQERPLFELWEHQREIVECSLFTNEHNIIHIPTSSGKSLIAQLTILKVLEETEDATCVYVVPTNALLNQVRNDLNSILGKMNLNVETLISGYDVINSDIEENQLDTSRVIIVTQEKLDSLIRREDDFIKKCKLFIFDEFQNISQGSRGLLLELIVTKIKCFNIGNQPKLVFLSAVLPNILSFKKWIGEDITCDYSNIDCRPTRQVKSIGYFKRSMPSKGRTTKYNETIDSNLRIFYENDGVGNIKLPTIERQLTNKSKYYRMQNFCADLSERFANIGNVLVYLPNTRWFKSFCNAMCEKDLMISTHEALVLKDIAEYVALTMKVDHYLVNSIKKGIAYHHKSLPDNVKRVIEVYFKRGIIKVLASTSTLAQGLNFPISTIIVGSLNVGGNVLTPADFQNLVGRAGRAMRETEGYVVLALPIKSEYSQNYNERYIDRINSEYLSINTEDIVVKSTIQNLIEVLKKQESDLDRQEKELIRTYNSIIFDLEQTGLLEEDESYDSIINSLFFSVEATEEDKNDLKSFTKEMVAAIKFKISAIEDTSMRKILKQSGLSLDSSIVIYEAVIEFYNNNIGSVFESNRLNKHFISLIDSVKNIPEFYIDKDGEFIFNYINSWIFLSSYKDICDQYFGGNYDNCINFISENIVYKSAWAFSIIYQIFERLLLDQLDELPYNSDFIRLLTDFSYLPAYCKFGVYNRNMIEILESGLYERELLIKVHTLFELHTQLVEYDLQLFYSWASAVTLVDVEDRNIKISKHEKQMWNDYKKSILGEIKLEIDIVSVSIKGYGMYDRKYLVRGEPLILIHEPENQYDPNAIKILSLDNKMLGYVPKRQTEIINDFIINKKAWMVFNKIDKGERVCYLYIIK